MPYAKILPIRSAKALSGKLAYLSNARHRNHKDKTVETAICHRTDSAAAFLAKTVATIRNINEKRKRGRNTKNLADEVIIRLPDFSNLTAQERGEFLHSTLAEFCPDSPAVAVWHLDQFNGSADLHVIVANFVDAYPPKTRRTSAFNPITLIRSSSDRITDIVNLRRRENGIVPIETMREARKRRLKQRGVATLAEQLAPLLPFQAEDLPAKIEALGYQVTRYSPTRDSISVRLSDARKAHRYSIDRLLSSTVSLSGPNAPTRDVSFDNDLDIGMSIS
jgi:hypothetical protein